jgi:protein involved in polysaccharide export with SLBB domain
LILRRGEQVEKYSLKDQATDNLLIKTGDILEFTVNEETQTTSAQQFYYTNGKGFISGGEKPYRQGLTLLQAITASGGLKKDNTKKIIVRRKNEEGKLIPTEIDLQAIKNGQAADFVVQAGDIIEVAN